MSSAIIGISAIQSIKLAVSHIIIQDAELLLLRHQLYQSDIFLSLTTGNGNV